MAKGAKRQFGTVPSPGQLDEGVETTEQSFTQPTNAARDASLPKVFGGTVFNPPVGK